MVVKDISVRTCKNHVETEISFAAENFKKGCYLVQTVSSACDGEAVACQMTAGIPSLKVLTCADAIPAIPSTKNEKYPYNLVTKVFDENDVLLEERTDTFIFTLPEHEKEPQKKSFFKKLFGN